MDDLKVSHLEMIQAVINRLANNSFVLKSWNITVVAGLFALSAKDANQRYVFIALLPALSFWGLDAYYLRQERLFRALHKFVASANTDSTSEFAMDTVVVQKHAQSWFRTLWAGTLFWLHGPIVIVIVVVLINGIQK